MSKAIFNIFTTFLFIGALSSLVSALPSIDFYETWSSNEGTSTDSVIWTDDDIDFEVNGITDFDADFVCFDWDNDENYDNCYYDSDGCGSSCNSESCNYYSVPYYMNDGWKTGCDVENNCREGTNVPERVCDGCNFDTSSINHTFVDAVVYYDCDNSQSNRYVDILNDIDFWVVYPKKYDCDGGTGEDKSGTGFYDFEGKYTAADWVDIKNNVGCPSYRVCDENSAHQYSDDQESTSRTGAITHPCTLENGATVNHLCSESTECYSSNCGGSKTENKYNCISDGGINYDDMFRSWSDTCGGAGYAGSWSTETTESCVVQSGSGYVCDEAHDGQVVESPSTPPSPCRKNIAESCSITTDCWNDDGGNWCNSISKCTDGANGGDCGSGSDCNSGYCCSGTCSASSCEEETDLAILDVIPIQVIPDVDMIKGKSGYVRVIVHNYGPSNATGQVNVSFDGNSLTPYNPTNASKPILVDANETFDFIFKPDVAGNDKVISVNLTVIE